MPITSVADPGPEINEISIINPYSNPHLDPDSNPDPKLCFGSATLPRTKADQETFDRIWQTKSLLHEAKKTAERPNPEVVAGNKLT
jgi:hypothetical protein